MIESAKNVRCNFEIAPRAVSRSSLRLATAFVAQHAVPPCSLTYSLLLTPASCLVFPHTHTDTQVKKNRRSQDVEYPFATRKVKIVKVRCFDMSVLMHVSLC